MRQRPAGYSIVELAFVTALVSTLCGIAIPHMLVGIYEFRTAGAARYVSTLLQHARIYHQYAKNNPSYYMVMFGDAIAGFVPPLGPGNYSFWVQDFNAGSFSYGFDFGVTTASAPVPEPGTIWMVPLAALALARRRSLSR